MNKVFIHEKALVETKRVGDNSKIWAFVHILPGAQIGSNANICDFCFIENDVIIGNNVTIKSGVYLWDGVTVEDDVHIGAAAAFTNDIFPRSKNKDWVLEKTLIKKGSSIGANATILPKITIGQYAMIGAGSVVTNDVPDFALVYGSPARIKGYVCVCGKKLVFEQDASQCNCGRAYKKNNRGVMLLQDIE